MVERIFQGYAPDRGTWNISSIHQILRNEAYRGWHVWNKTKKVRKPDGKQTKRNRPRTEQKIRQDAHPAIIDDELWEAAGATRDRQK